MYCTQPQKHIQVCTAHRSTYRSVLHTEAHTGLYCTQPQKHIQATAEQIRLAQVIYDKNDADFEGKVKQLMEVTGKNQDECMVALHDCNEDVNRAINFLLEDSSDTTSWETVGKKRGLVKEGSSSENKENKENREKRGEREASRGRGGPIKRGRGANRTRDVRSEENGVDLGPGERGVDRRGRGRGRGSGVRGRGRGAGGSRFSSQGMGTFNPADYTPNSGSGAGGARSDTWESGAKDSVDGTGAWRNSLDDWVTEDWNEDLSETKVFTSSATPGTENHITPGQSLDLASLLRKPGGPDMGETADGEPPSADGLGHSLVFTNSQHLNSRSSAPSYAHAALSSVLGSGFGSLGGSKPAPQASGPPVLDQLKGSGLGPRPAQPPVAGGNGAPSGVPPPAPAVTAASPAAVSTTAWDIKPPVQTTTTTLSSQFSRDFKTQPEPSLVLSQLAQRQQSALPQPEPLPQARPASPATRPTPSPPGLEPFPKPRDPSPSRDGPSPGAKASAAAATDPQVSGGSQQRQMKTQKRRIPPSSKIPSSAVEMPGSADVSGLNVQFGALDFGSEPALPDFGQPDSCGTREPAPAAQTPNSLYSKPISEPLGSSLSIPLSSLPSSLAPPSSATPPAASSSSSSSSSSGSGVETAAPSHPHLPFSQSQDSSSSSSSAPVSNGFNGVRTTATHERCGYRSSSATSASSTPKPESPALGGSSSSSARPPSALLPPSVPPHNSALPSLASEMPTAPLPALNSSLSSSHANSSQSSALTSSSSLTHTSVDSSISHTVSAPLSSNNGTAGGGVVGVTSSAHGTGVLGLTANGTTVPSVCRTAPLPSSSSGKAPPNLAQGVPPLLPNQYIMGPGGLLPAYPIYGYEDLQMLQSRLPMDYYGITFPGPAATLAGRDGSLANTPYSGEVTKFGRADSASPAPPTSLSAPPQQAPQGQSGAQSQAPQQQGGHGGQQAFLNAALPPGYGYTGLPYYPGVPGVPSAFQYGPTMFMPPASAKQHGVGLGNPSTQFQQQQQQQQQAAYGQHTYASGFDDLSQGPGDYSKGGYSSSSQAQAKAASASQGKGISVTSSNAGVPDMTTSVYNKTQSFDKQGFHTGTPPPFSLPSALGGTGPLNPGGAPGYAPAPFLHILPAHQQPHSQLLHHHLTQDGQGGPSQRSQSSSMQQKTQVTKSSYGGSPYWGN
ncbi:ubiquitin-associated protein 2a isoform X4 [Anguilla rostrata]|uniref:ubiquitin-associated protein 2a isoform X4 n=1 Tax=Anguilla rostrata TaxID=7938 RepID=UPI0030CB5DDA